MVILDHKGNRVYQANKERLENKGGLGSQAKGANQAPLDHPGLLGQMDNQVREEIVESLEILGQLGQLGQMVSI